jgi:hypothetical protein
MYQLTNRNLLTHSEEEEGTEVRNEDKETGTIAVNNAHKNNTVNHERKRGLTSFCLHEIQHTVHVVAVLFSLFYKKRKSPLFLIEKEHCPIRLPQVRTLCW